MNPPTLYLTLLLSTTSRKVALALLFLTLVCTCAPSPEKSETDGGEKPAVKENVAEVEIPPSIPLERLQHIYDNATYMDATFYELPISINQSTQPQIQSMIGGIAADPMNNLAGCKPLGHMWFQIDGVNVEEADIYFSEGCVGFVWYDAGKPAFSNAMTQDGLNFFANVLQSVQQGGQQ